MKALKLHMYFQSICGLFPLLAIKDFTLEDPVSKLPITTCMCFVQLNPMVLASAIMIPLLFLSLWWLNRNFKGSKSQWTIAKVDNSSFEMMSFLATYVIPFTATNSQDIRSLIVMALLLVFLGFIAMRTNSFYMNPTLTLLGYRVYRAQLEDQEEEFITISRQALRKGSVVLCQNLDPKVLFARIKA